VKPHRIRLFIKRGCGWCDEASDWLDARGFEYEQLDVTANPASRREMLALSGQTLAPVIEVDGQVLADFGADELENWWREEGFASHGSKG
jgi:glutaredoxin